MCIESQIAKHCEAEPISASELYEVLRSGNEITIKGESYLFAEITDLLTATDVRIAAEESQTTNKYAIPELYIKRISEMMG